MPASWTATVRALGVAAGLFVALPVPAAGADWAVYAGQFDLDRNHEAGEAGFEVRLPMSRPPLGWPLEWVGGLAGTDDGAYWAYAGTAYDWLRGRWHVRPGFAVGLWERGDGKDLGGLVEFRSSIELAFEASERLRLGLLFYHLSNAGLYDRNPGSNSVVLVATFRR